MTKPIARLYRRNLAAACPELGWAEVPDCPLPIFARILGVRAQAHPEKDVPTVEYRARILNEAIYRSKKIANVQPPEWRAEFPWLLALSNTDGTFEADPRSVWSQAYAFARPDWTPEQVGQLLDEFERVGLLLRTQDADGRLWGYWVGSDNFQPPPSKRNHYKKGPRDLFGATKNEPENAAAASPAKPLCTPGADNVNTQGTMQQPEFDSDVELRCDLDYDYDSELKRAPTSSENEQQPKQEQVKNASSEEQDLSPRTVAPKPEAFTNRIEYGAACHAAGVLPVSRAAFKSREVLPKDEYLHEKGKEKTDRDIAEWKAEIEAREPCPVCKVKHPKPFCKQN